MPKPTLLVAVLEQKSFTKAARSRRGPSQRPSRTDAACRFRLPELDDLLGTFVRLKREGILPLRAADHGLGTAFYYAGPD